MSEPATTTSTSAPSKKYGDDWKRLLGDKKFGDLHETRVLAVPGGVLVRYTEWDYNDLDRDGDENAKVITNAVVFVPGASMSQFYVG